MRRFEPARTLHFVTSENLRVRYHCQFGRLEEKAAGQRPQPDAQRPRMAQAVFPPNLLEPLPLAIVVAKQMHPVALARPPVQLLEEFPPLCRDDRRLGPLPADGPENLQTLERQRLLVLQAPPIHNHVLDLKGLQ